MNRRSIVKVLAAVLPAAVVSKFAAAEPEASTPNHIRKYEMELDKQRDGKLPPVIFMSLPLNRDGRWYPSYEPDTVMHIEVAASINCTIAFDTPSKSGKGTYHQYFMSVPQMVKNWHDPNWRQYYGMPRFNIVDREPDQIEANHKLWEECEAGGIPLKQRPIDLQVEPTIANYRALDERILEDIFG
jgi:hypothetical protein